MVLLNRNDRLQHRFMGTLTRRRLDPPVPLYWQHWRLDSTGLAALTEAVRATARAALR